MPLIYKKHLERMALVGSTAIGAARCYIGRGQASIQRSIQSRRKGNKILARPCPTEPSWHAQAKHTCSACLVDVTGNEPYVQKIERLLRREAQEHPKYCKPTRSIVLGTFHRGTGPRGSHAQVGYVDTYPDHKPSNSRGRLNGSLCGVGRLREMVIRDSSAAQPHAAPCMYRRQVPWTRPSL